MITLHQFPQAFGLPSASPICMKLELWLRMAGLNYQCVYHHDPRLAPRSKLPFIEQDGKALPDSNEIVSYFVESGQGTIDQYLTAEQQADSRAWRYLLEDQLNLYLTFSRFHQPDNWQLFKHEVFAVLPDPQNNELPELLKSGITPGLTARGFAIENRVRVVEQALADVEAVAVFLDEKPFFMGDQVSSIDASVAAVLLHAIAMPWEDEVSRAITRQPALMRYCHSIMARYFPELSLSV
jgi:glutathione S-transferase